MHQLLKFQPSMILGCQNYDFVLIWLPAVKASMADGK